MQEMFDRVIELDNEINQAWDVGDQVEADRLYVEQERIVDEIEARGFRPAFDLFIKSIS